MIAELIAEEFAIGYDVLTVFNYLVYLLLCEVGRVNQMLHISWGLFNPAFVRRVVPEFEDALLPLSVYVSFLCGNLYKCVQVGE